MAVIGAIPVFAAAFHYAPSAALVAALAVFAAALFFLPRRGGGPVEKGALKIVSSVRLPGGGAVHMLTVGERMIVAGTCGGRMTRLDAFMMQNPGLNGPADRSP
jgi:hypothetical protein